jgi:hypothetical protein
MTPGLFRPHWKHKQCGGTVMGIDSSFECLKCGSAAVAIGAELPDFVENRREYFACHPELEVVLLSEQEVRTVGQAFR